MTDLSQADWRKASRSNAANGGCVEIAANYEDVVAVRDSKHPEGGAHVVARAVFAAFLADAKSGRYDPDVVFRAALNRRQNRARRPRRAGSVRRRKPLGCPPAVSAAAPPVSSRDG